MSHTAGPWAVHPVNAQVDAFVGGKPLPICQLLWPTTERTEAETEANASLIAAAPDLFAAAREAYTNGEWVSGDVSGWVISKEVYEMLQEACERVELTQQQRANDTAGQGT